MWSALIYIALHHFQEQQVACINLVNIFHGIAGAKFLNGISSIRVISSASPLSV